MKIAKTLLLGTGFIATFVAGVTVGCIGILGCIEEMSPGIATAVYSMARIIRTNPLKSESERNAANAVKVFSLQK